MASVCDRLLSRGLNCRVPEVPAAPPLDHGQGGWAIPDTLTAQDSSIMVLHLGPLAEDELDIRQQGDAGDQRFG
jgi:hypothetical protein